MEYPFNFQSNTLKQSFLRSTVAFLSNSYSAKILLHCDIKRLLIKHSRLSLEEKNHGSPRVCILKMVGGHVIGRWLELECNIPNNIIHMVSVQETCQPSRWPGWSYSAEHKLPVSCLVDSWLRRTRDINILYQKYFLCLLGTAQFCAAG